MEKKYILCLFFYPNKALGIRKLSREKCFKTLFVTVLGAKKEVKEIVYQTC